MACGTSVKSVYGGAPDRAKYLIATEDFPRKLGFQKTNLTDENLGLNELYAQVRKIRERGLREDSLSQMSTIHAKLEAFHTDDWLLRMELLELDQSWSLRAPWRTSILARLAEIARANPDVERMIRRGMELLA